MEQSIDHVVETLRHIQGEREQCTLLIGAGCSVTAGIPAASGIVEFVKDHYPNRYDCAEKKTYPHVMAQLLLDERREVIQHYVHEAKINWAHICIAQLMTEGYVDRVLTTNFDPLVMRACALLGEFPAVYDFGISQMFNSSFVASKALFHLHGQHSGFVTLHTPRECEEHGKRLSPLFEDACRGRTWIVVGYSGESDPVFEQLAKIKKFTRGLYWVGYEDEEPPKHIQEKLLRTEPKKDAFYIRNYNADSFFIKLAQELNVFPPSFIAKPFSHMDLCLSMLTEFPLEHTDCKEDVTATPRGWIAQAIERHESSPDMTEKAENLLMEGRYEEASKLLPPDRKGLSSKSITQFAWAYFLAGSAVIKRARTKSGDDVDRLFAEAYEKYQKALEIKPNMHEAFNNWGNALLEQAKAENGADADRLFVEAEEKYQKALEIKPDKHEAFNNWGVALMHYAREKSGADADRLFAEAEEKYQKVKEIAPGAESYNMACLSVLRGKEQDCHKWLVTSLQNGKIPSRKHIEEDSDLDSVREKDWYLKFLAELPD